VLAQGVDPEEEIARVVPVIEGLAPSITISVDTYKPAVAQAAIAAGASLDLGAITVPVINPIGAQLLLGSPVDLGLTTGAVTLSDDFGSTNDAVIDVINLGTVP